MPTFSPETGVQRMLLKVRLLLCSAGTCVRSFACCCGWSLVSTYLRCEFLCCTRLSLYLGLMRGCILVHYSAHTAVMTWLHEAGLIIFTLVITQPNGTKQNQWLTIIFQHDFCTYSCKVNTYGRWNPSICDAVAHMYIE